VHRDVRERLAVDLDAGGPALRKLRKQRNAAARLGITKETMSRLLRELKQQGLIAMSGASITILDRARLAGLAREPASALD